MTYKGCVSICVLLNEVVLLRARFATRARARWGLS